MVIIPLQVKNKCHHFTSSAANLIIPTTLITEHHKVLMFLYETILHSLSTAGTNRIQVATHTNGGLGDIDINGLNAPSYSLASVGESGYVLAFMT